MEGTNLLACDETLLVQVAEVLRAQGEKVDSGMPGSVQDLLVVSEGFHGTMSLAGFSGFQGSERCAFLAKGVADVEGVVVGASEELRGVVAPAGFKLVENGVVLIEVAQLVE